MIKSITIISVLFSALNASAQNKAPENGIASPVPSRDVCKLLNRSMGADTFNFCGKRIAYAGLSHENILHQRHEPGLNGIEDATNFSYRLLVLDPSEKQVTAGYDAIILRYYIGDEMKQKHLDRREIIDAVYDVGAQTAADTDSTRNESNIRFINRLLSNSLRRQIDVRETRIAIVQSKYGKKNHGITRLSYSQYRRILEDNLRFRSGDVGTPHWLNSGQKSSAGGYDLIINVRESKKGIPVEKLVDVVSRSLSGTNGRHPAHFQDRSLALINY